MESVINFLAEYYIWFFVAAGVLLFALIGFLIDSKKKNNAFKGESAPVENKEPAEENIPVAGDNLAVSLEGTIENENSNVSEAPKVDVKPEMDYTMEINDIPLTEPEEVKIEPTLVNPELSQVKEETISKPAEFNSVQTLTNNQNNSDNNSIFETPSVGEKIEDVTTEKNSFTESPSQSSLSETKEVNNTENSFEIFDDLK